MLWIILGIIGSILMTFLYCCLVVSSKCSREEEKIKFKMQLETYIENVSIKNDYEIIRTVGMDYNFLDDMDYAKMVGDFDNLIFPNPDDIQEDKSLIGNIQNSNINDYINVTFIPAIRDVNLELTKNGNFLENILNNISDEIDDDRWKNVKNKFGEINTELQSIQEYSVFTDNVVNLMKDTVGAVYSSDMFLDVSLPEDKKYLIKYFSLKGKIDNHSLSLYNKSLGENNIIYFALKRDYNSSYLSTWNFEKAQERNLFEETFGRSEDLHYEEIVKITYGKNTIYEDDNFKVKEEEACLS